MEIMFTRQDLVGFVTEQEELRGTNAVSVAE